MNTLSSATIYHSFHPYQQPFPNTWSDPKRCLCVTLKEVNGKPCSAKVCSSNQDLDQMNSSAPIFFTWFSDAPTIHVFSIICGKDQKKSTCEVEQYQSWGLVVKESKQLAQGLSMCSELISFIFPKVTEAGKLGKMHCPNRTCLLYFLSYMNLPRLHAEKSQEVLNQVLPNDKENKGPAEFWCFSSVNTSWRVSQVLEHFFLSLSLTQRSWANSLHLSIIGIQM